MATTKPKVVERGAAGLLVWALPEAGELEIMWPGPGAGLLIGMPRQPGGMVTRIDHPTASGAFATEREATAAVAAFIAAASEA